MISPLRSLLFAPGNKVKHLQKFSEIMPDGAVIDLEDAVPQSEKEIARANIETVGSALVKKNFHTFVRVNSIGSGLFADDVASLIPGLAGVLIPKIESREGVERAIQELDGTPAASKIVVGIETVAGLDAVKEILSYPEVLGAYFGAEDFIADLGGVRTRENTEVLFARSQIAIAGRLAGIPVLDQIVADFRDLDRFEKEAHEARSFGFAGKLCVHPLQVPVANNSFTPSASEIIRAKSLLAVYEAGVEQGTASVVFEGQMVDEALAKQARILLAQII
ncbi:MAG: CoA ester lyase [Acidimicrobiales bacterium]|nr:CoA ester lyase [Acidimicrobiales bacterium]